MSDACFLQKMRDEPLDETVRLVFADWNDDVSPERVLLSFHLRLVARCMSTIRDPSPYAIENLICGSCEIIDVLRLRWKHRGLRGHPADCFLSLAHQVELFYYGLGFRPVPAHWFYPPQGADEAHSAYHEYGAYHTLWLDTFIAGRWG